VCAIGSGGNVTRRPRAALKRQLNPLNYGTVSVSRTGKRRTKMIFFHIEIRDVSSISCVRHARRQIGHD
jgi:hypothetical protein